MGRQSRSRLISFYQKGGVETLRGGFYSVTALSGVNAEDNLRVPPRSQDGLELKDYSDNEAVRSRGQDLVYAIPGTKYF